MTSKQPATFQSTQILYYAMFAGQFMIGLILMFMMDQNGAKSPDPPFNMIIPGSVLGGILLSLFIQQQRNSTIPSAGAVSEKLEHFRTSSILKYAVLEAGNLISLILTFQMANTNYMMWFAIGLAAFTLMRPTKTNFESSYNIAQGEEYK